MEYLGCNDMQHILRSARIGVWRVEFEAGRAPRFYADRVMDELLGISGDVTPEKRFLYHRAHIHKEDQEFLDKVIETIEKNITNPDLSVELLSSDLGYSTRQFYRKLKPITDKSPADIIKEYRLTMAERLLLTKNYTIEEIMDKTGFNNRGTFYKLFSQRFGMPPRQYREQQKDSVKKELTDMDSINE